MPGDGQIKVWVPSKEHVWEQVSVLSGEGTKSVEVQPDQGAKKTVNLDDAYKAIGMVNREKGDYTLPMCNTNVPEGGVDDMASFDNLHEPAVLNNLELRFAATRPYTYTGTTCIAVNPYQWISAVYDEGLRKQYMSKPRNQLQPHAYAFSAKAFSEMHSYNANQSILVSGESGAGKTETVKILMNHLATISKEHEYNTLAQEMQGIEGEEEEWKAKVGEQEAVITKILQSNPILESFGNAKTSRNDNSSRFGKFVQLLFDFKSCLTGAHTNTYLLEKSRVVWQADGERNYHIFHQVASCQARELAVMCLTDKKYRYMSAKGAGATNVIEGVNDQEHFKKTKDALKMLGIAIEQQALLFRMLAGILNLGEVKFVPAEGDDGRSEISQDSLKTVTDAAKMLGVDGDALVLTLTSRMLVMRGGASVTRVPLKPEDAVRGADATSKNLYSRVFDWLVESINATIDASSAYHIDLLDIFGFESFEHNSFEQLCINYTNETLQQKFCQDVFKNVMDEYKAEGLALANIKFPDNQVVLDTIQSRSGLLALLNEECLRCVRLESYVSDHIIRTISSVNLFLRPGGSDTSFASKFIQAFAKKDSPVKRDRKVDHKFVVVHYAEEVCYDVTGWCEKNKDALLADMVTILRASQNAVVALMFTAKKRLTDDDGLTKKPGRARGSSLNVNTVSMQFKKQVASLMNDIKQTTVQYIRCIKPNKNKSASEFDRTMVVLQLRSAGVVEAIRMSRAAFPNRLLKNDFLDRFCLIMPGGRKAAKEASKVADALLTEHCAELAATAAKDGKQVYACGKSKIFFMRGVLEAFEAARLKGLDGKLIKIQSWVRMLVKKREFKFQMRCAGSILKMQAQIIR
jgi:myosin-5